MRNTRPKPILPTERVLPSPTEIPISLRNSLWLPSVPWLPKLSIRYRMNAFAGPTPMKKIHRSLIPLCGGNPPSRRHNNKNGNASQVPTNTKPPNAPALPSTGGICLLQSCNLKQDRNQLRTLLELINWECTPFRILAGLFRCLPANRTGALRNLPHWDPCRRHSVPRNQANWQLRLCLQ